jgi:hypothetical protein
MAQLAFLLSILALVVAGQAQLYPQQKVFKVSGANLGSMAAKEIHKKYGQRLRIGPQGIS